jgi:ABC-type uncharacterized transport system permease subunit
MDAVLSTLNHLLPVLLAAAWMNYSCYFVREDPFAGRTVTPFLAMTASVHLLYVVLLAVRYQHHPMASIFEVLTVIALAITLVYLAVETQQKNKFTGIFILPVIFVFQLISSIGIAPTEEIHPILRDYWFGLHTGTVALAYAAFLLSAVYGVMYLLLYQALRNKRFGLIFERLPSLDVLVRMTMGATLVGFIFLTLALAFGTAWAADRIPSFWRDFKFLFNLLAWAVYGVSVVSHYVHRWTGHRVVSVALLGFTLMVVALVSVRLGLPTFHEFGG